MSDREAIMIGADRLAGAVSRLIRVGIIGSRSDAGDALLDYAMVRWGDNINALTKVDERYAELSRVSAPPESPR